MGVDYEDHYVFMVTFFGQEETSIMWRRGLENLADRLANRINTTCPECCTGCIRQNQIEQAQAFIDIARKHKLYKSDYSTLQFKVLDKINRVNSNAV